MTPELTIALLIVAALVGVGIRELHERGKRRQLERSVTSLEADVAKFNQRLQDDPQRAGIDMGKRYATNAMQHTIDQLREEEQ